MFLHYSFTAYISDRADIRCPRWVLWSNLYTLPPNTRNQENPPSIRGSFAVCRNLTSFRYGGHHANHRSSHDFVGSGWAEVNRTFAAQSLFVSLDPGSLATKCDTYYGTERDFEQHVQIERTMNETTN